MTAKRLIDVLGRENFPMADGCLHYFPDALAYVSYVSLVGDRQHNHDGQPMHWSRGKSTDHDNKIMKHLSNHTGVDTDEVLHAGKVAWRALARLQEALEELHGLDLPPRAWVDVEAPAANVEAPVSAFGEPWFDNLGFPPKEGGILEVEMMNGKTLIGYVELFGWDLLPGVQYSIKRWRRHPKVDQAAK